MRANPTVRSWRIRPLAVCFVLSLAAGCGADPGPAVSTAYREGDWVVYEYSGTFTPAPVRLTEQVIERVGNRLTLEVEAVRDDERLKWRQVVIDGEGAEGAGRIEALLEWRDGRFEQVPNGDLYRLLGWTLPEGGGRIELGATRSQTLELGGLPRQCIVQTGRQMIGDALTDLELTTCPDFVWSQGPAVARIPGGEIIWQVKVLEAGGR